MLAPGFFGGISDVGADLTDNLLAVGDCEWAEGCSEVRSDSFQFAFPASLRDLLRFQNWFKKLTQAL